MSLFKMNALQLSWYMYQNTLLINQGIRNALTTIWAILTHQSSYVAFAWRATVGSDWEACRRSTISHIKIGTLQVFAEPKRHSCCTTSWLRSCITIRTRSLCKAIDNKRKGAFTEKAIFPWWPLICFYPFRHQHSVGETDLWLCRTFGVLLCSSLTYFLPQTLLG
jgi:hypothetical protein